MKRPSLAIAAAVLAALFSGCLAGFSYADEDRVKQAVALTEASQGEVPAGEPGAAEAASEDGAAATAAAAKEVSPGAVTAAAPAAVPAVSAAAAPGPDASPVSAAPVVDAGVFPAPYTGLDPASGPGAAATGADEGGSMVKMSGTYGMSMGFTTDDFLWKTANGDWQEKNWRYATGDLDVDTYDPRIFDRYELEIETDTHTPWNGYCDVVVDPWSFLQVGHERVVNEAGTNYVEVDYKGWQNTGYTINQRLRTASGQTIFIPEQKILGNQVTQFTGDPVYVMAGLDPFVFSPGRTVDTDYIFRPVRKLWVEYNTSPLRFKAFPIADQAEALTADDPLRLSNNHVYWAPSPWLWRFDPGIVFDPMAAANNPGAALPPPGQQPAMWNWDEAWFAEDSNRHYLTFLRGVSVGWNVEDYASLDVTGATPLGLWDTYDTVTSVPLAARLKMNPTEKLTIGATYASKYGIAKQECRAQNYVLGGDVTYKIMDKTALFGEVAGSVLNVEHASEEISKDTGSAYKLGARSDMELSADSSLKSDAYISYMSPNFAPGLSDYRDSREDRDWGRHIWFEPLSSDDLGSRIGDGIDVNRYTVGANASAKMFDNFFDIFLNWRNVHSAEASNKFIENTARAEVTCNPMSRVQMKGLILLRKYHDSLGGYDPILRNRYTDQFYFSQGTLPGWPQTNVSAVEDGMDVDIRTFSGGLKVDVIPEKLTVYGIFEATNDPQDFPRQILSNPYSLGPDPICPPIPFGSFNTNYTHDNIIFSQINDALYGQNLFNQPPYNDFFTMWKGCVKFRPAKEIEFRYTHVTNTNKNYAALFDNNHTHDEMTAIYRPFKNITWTSGCSISRVINLKRAVDTSAETFWPYATISSTDRQYQPHTNVYSQVEWGFKKDQKLTFQFGESWFVTSGGDVFGPQWQSTTSSVLDTRAIFRVWYQGKF